MGFLILHVTTDEANVMPVIARNMVKEVHHPQCGNLKLVNSPIKLSSSEPGVRIPPPTLGQHTNEILSEVLDMKESEVEALKRKGVLR